MAEPLIPDVVVNICQKCVGDAVRFPRQWKQEGALVAVRELPCSGKVDIQYLLHALEGVSQGVCVVACPPGKCRLAQGNHRAAMRLETVRRLLGEVGLEPDRAQLVYFSSAEEPRSKLDELIHAAVERLTALGPNPLLTPVQPPSPTATRAIERRDGWAAFDSAQPA
jgi:F420-non-reducing hydrogenase iron-sulfur subunit